MVIPQSKQHLHANMRHSMSEMLQSAKSDHPMYSQMAWQFAHCFFLENEWSSYASELSEMKQDGLMDEENNRRLICYREGTFPFMTAELAHLGWTKMTKNSKGAYVPKKGSKCSVLRHGVRTGHDADDGGKKKLQKVEVTDKSMLAMARMCGKSLVEIRLPFHIWITHDPFRKLLRKCRSLRILDLTSTIDLITDDVLLHLPTWTPSLERLCFGEDNVNLKDPLSVTVNGLVACAKGCVNLKVLRILHRTQSGDPAERGGEIYKALGLECDMVLKFPCDPSGGLARECREDFMNRESHFWRVSVEDGILSSCWYERICVRNFF